MSAAESFRPTFDLKAALSADVKSTVLRKGEAIGEDQYFTAVELHAIEQAALQELHLLDAQIAEVLQQRGWSLSYYSALRRARKWARHVVALCRSERNLVAAYVNGTITDADAEPF